MFIAFAIIFEVHVYEMKGADWDKTEGWLLNIDYYMISIILHG